MSLPVSSYEELLRRVRSLTHETRRLHRELAACSDTLQDEEPDILTKSLDSRESSSERLFDSAMSSRRSTFSRSDTDVMTATPGRTTSSSSLPNPAPSPLTTSEEDRTLQLLARLGLATPQPPSTHDLTSPLDRSSDQDLTRSSTSSVDGSCGSPPPAESTTLKSPPLGPPGGLGHLYHGTWPVDPPAAAALWHSGPASLTGPMYSSSASGGTSDDHGSVHSFSISHGHDLVEMTGLAAARRSYSQQQLGAKYEMVYGLLSMLGTNDDRQDMARTLLAMSSSPDSCQAMRQSGCLPLLIQLVHGHSNGEDSAPGRSIGISASDRETRIRASQALHNVVHASQGDEKRGRREARVLRLLEQVRDYCDALSIDLERVLTSQPPPRARGAPLLTLTQAEMERHPGTSVAALMKLSFDEEHRLAMCQLGGLHCVAELLELDHAAHGAGSSDQYCVTLRRYAGMALTNLTFGDGGNKALLCSLRPFMRALVGQLDSPSEDLRQVTASVLRNLSWRADTASKGALREVGAVPGLMRAAMDAQKESTLKSILSALWNLSAHCSVNKVDICVVPGALPFLVSMLTYQAPSKTLAIVENAGGILRNISSHIAVREDYRAILRQHNCLQILLQQLKSPSLTVVSNACGALWNLSARSPEDQAALWEMGAVPMLRSLVNSKHKMISMGSSAALKNLLSARPSTAFDLIGNGAKAAAVALGLTSSSLPVGLYVRKQRALEQELDENLAETCDNIEPSTSPTVPLRDETASRYSYSSVTSMDQLPSRRGSLAPPRYRTPGVARSDSKDSVTSTHSDSVYERLRAASAGNKFSYSQTAAVSGVVTSTIVTKLSRSEDQASLHSSLGRRTEIENNSDRRFLSRYANAMRELRPATNSNGTVIDNPLTSSSTMSTIEENKSLSGAKPRTSNFPAYNRTSNDTYVRKLSDLAFEETQEQPVNYSLKFVEHKTEEKQEICKNNLDRNYPRPFDNPTNASTKNNIKMNVVYGDYAETDLDQPTDYSLKYADEEEEDKDEYYQSTVPHISSEDSTKTYCTEGTPCNFSTATSMSDLHVEEKLLPKSDLKEDKKIETKEIDSKNASGVMSPEKPIQYCEEGTPVCFSRVSSLSSLNSLPHTTTTNTPKTIKPEPKELDKEIKLKEEKEVVKAVTFVENQQETPLMFSRCSSLGSLSSFDQHSIHDDRSSVVSDFSRLTSGMVSPSELPDSPTQTVPASPRHPMVRLPNRPITTGASHSPQTSGPSSSTANPSSSNNPPILLPPAKRSVFEDQISSFKEEDAPFSCATSLSSLTIDDDPKPTRISFRKEKEEGYEKHDIEKECSELAPVSEEEENEEDMLAACINIGKQISNSKRTTTQPSTSVLTRIPRVTGIPKMIKAISPPSKGPFDDTLQTYCTEGTPANISHAGSHSDLSILSFPSELGAPANIPLEEREELNLDESADINLNISDSSSNISGDNDNMLAECIQSGMPQSRQLPARRAFEQSSPVPPGPTSAAPFLPTDEIKSVPLPVTTDEIRSFDFEGTPLTFSRGSSLSDLTIHSIDENHVTRAGLIKRRARNRGQPDETSSSVPTVYESIDDQFEAASNSGAQAGKSSTSDNIITVLSRNGSLSSLSVDSLGSTEPSPAEQALLEQCINSGMPKSKSNSQLTNNNSLIPRNEEEPKNVTTPASAPNVDVESTVTNIDIDQGETMIRSLDRLTKELVEGLNLEPVESTVEMRQSATDTGNTWNEEESTSPNDVTFPTCSMSQSSNGNQPQNNNVAHHLSEVVEEDSLTSSQALEIEADKIVEAVKAMDQSVSSCGDFDLDKVNPPSQMDSLISLSASMTSMTESDRRCPRTPKSRKKSLPLGMMVRRALGNCNNGSTESILENLSLCSNLDQQKPPSAMEDLPDAADMENSMLSVASITSEVADLAKHSPQHSPPANDDEETRPIVFPQPLSIPDYPDTEATCSEIDSLTHKIEDDFSEHTTVLSECSVESTPKRTSKLRRIPTPRERRNIGKDRYRTYTIDNTDIEEAKKTPKQRRQLDRQRFETRILDSSTLIAAVTAVSTPEPEDDVETAETLTPETSQPNSPRRITPKQRRSENKDRFKTRTLKDELPVPTEEMLERNANIVISTLKSVDTRTESETQSGDEFLDLETLSLVSIDSDTDTGGARRQSNKQPDVVQAQAQAPAQPDLVQPCDHDDIEDDDDDDDIEEDLPEDPEEPRKPRIIKPGDSIERDSSVESEKEVKGIRGRRKPLYSSPSVTTRRTIKPPTVNQVRPTRASSMRQTGKSNMPVSKPPSAKSSPKKTNKSAPPTSPPPPPPKPLERQGTFTKDEPTHKTKIPILSASPRRVASAPASEKGGSVSRARAATTPPQRLSRISTTVKRSTPGNGLVNSSSTQSLKSGGQLSTSNQSINSISSSVSGKRSANKKEVTSKIASLWKRVEESKAKQQHQQTTIRKDTRVWIGGNSGEQQQQQSQLQKPSKLMRSSTFEGGIPVASRNSQTKTTTTRLQNNNARGSLAAKHRASGDFSWTSSDQQQQVTMRGGKTPEDPTKRFSRLGSFVKAGQDQSPAAIKITSV